MSENKFTKEREPIEFIQIIFLDILTLSFSLSNKLIQKHVKGGNYFLN